MYPLGVQVQCQRDQVNVAGPLAVAKQAALDAVGPCHYCEFGGGYRGAAVIMGVDAQHDAVAPLQVVVHPLDLVGVQIGRGCLDGGRQIQNDLVVGCRLPRLCHGVAYFQREFGFGGAEDFRGVLVAPLSFGVFGHAGLDQGGPRQRDPFDLLLAHFEHDFAEGGSAGVIQMNDRLSGASCRFHRAADQILA